MTEEDRRAEAEFDAAIAREGQRVAEQQRDIAADIARAEAAERATTQNALQYAQNQAREAAARERIMTTSANRAEQAAVEERIAANRTTFGATVFGVIAAGAAILAVCYFAWWQPKPPVDNSTTTVIRTEKSVETRAAVPPVVVQPPSVIVRPPAVHVDVKVPKPDATPLPEPTMPPIESQDSTSDSSREKTESKDSEANPL